MKDTRQLNIRNVPADLLKKAQEIAKQQDRQLSQVVRELLRQYVKANEQDPTK